MKTHTIKLPFYVKLVFVLLLLFALIIVLFIGKAIIMPIFFSGIFAILLHPVVRYLEAKRINRIFAIVLVVMLALLVIMGVMYFIFLQMGVLNDLYPKFRIKWIELNEQIQHWTTGRFSPKGIDLQDWVKKSPAFRASDWDYTKLFSRTMHVLLVGLSIPVYVFLLIYYKPMLQEFVLRLFGPDNLILVKDIIYNTKKIIQSYLIGLLFELLIVAVLNSIGLFFIGLDSAIILGVTGAFLNIIPYLGGALALSITMFFAWVTKDSLEYPVAVFFVYVFIQLLDNNYILPKLVASKVKINALFSILAVLAGGALWGVAGMFLSIPFIAIVKVICDHIESLKPWGFLLGTFDSATLNSLEKSKA